MKATPSQTIGPFFAVALGREEMVEGGSLVVTGRVLDGERRPVSDAYLELWDGKLFGRCPTDADGLFSISTAVPPAGYIAVSLFARGLLRRLATRIYFDAAEAPDASLVARPADGSDAAGPARGAWRFDFHLQGPEETTFFAV